MPDYRMCSCCMPIRHAQGKEIMDPERLWRDLKDEIKELIKDPTNQDLRFHVCSLLEALSTWIKRGGFPPSLQENT